MATYKKTAKERQLADRREGRGGGGGANSYNGENVGHSFAYVAHFVFLRDVWIRTKRAAVASRRATNLVNHLPD